MKQKENPGIFNVETLLETDSVLSGFMDQLKRVARENTNKYLRDHLKPAKLFDTWEKRSCANGAVTRMEWYIALMDVFDNLLYWDAPRWILKELCTSEELGPFKQILNQTLEFLMAEEDARLAATKDHDIARESVVSELETALDRVYYLSKGLISNVEDDTQIQEVLNPDYIPVDPQGRMTPDGLELWVRAASNRAKKALGTHRLSEALWKGAVWNKVQGDRLLTQAATYPTPESSFEN